MADQNMESGPHMEVIDRVRNIPVVQSAIEKTGSTYTNVKDSHYLINWALSYAEAGLTYATATAAPIASPIAKKFEGQINAVDQKLCEGLDIVQDKLPIVKEPPKQIYEAAKNVMSSSLQPTIDKFVAAKESATNQAMSLKEMSVSKANEILSTHYGSMALQSVDSSTALINKLLDHYFPPIENEPERPAPVSADENKVLHAVQTIGQLSSKTASRVYHSIAAQLKTVKKEDVQQYMSSVISILHLTQFMRNGAQKEPDTPTEEPATENKEKQN